MEAGKIGLPMVLMPRLNAGCGTWPLVSWVPQTLSLVPPPGWPIPQTARMLSTPIWHIFGNYCKSDLLENCGFFPL